MTAVHQLSPGLFERLASGAGGVAAIRELRAAQLSKRLLLIRFLLTDPARDLLERVRIAAPDHYRDILGAPLVAGWAAIAARAADDNVLAEADRLFLNAIALVAADAAGLAATLDVPVHDGRAVLPGVGAFEALPATFLRVTTPLPRAVFPRSSPAATPSSGAALSPSAALSPGGGWLPVRGLAAAAGGLTIRLTLDDLHPYRHGHHAPPANRLSDEALDRWQTSFTEAWRLLATHLPTRAAELATGLETLVPLVQTDPRSARAATLRHAFGVFGLTLPRTPHDFAVTLVHEFQHSKLSALLDLAQLTDPADDRHYFAPWREDPRPLPGLLQGVYAFVGVADTWRALRPEIEVATARFAEARLQADRGLTAVEESGALTPDGTAFVAALRETTDRLLAEPLPPQADEDARRKLADTYTAWQQRRRQLI
ncbi:hypothetical protein GCM10010172_60870 [Paractinoplanes ferrugineus]|uniref:HEXXH motif-containing protein n=1 Tax=Paractinoplanes ferrugineus TaxID=113564 RepID=A0A919J648_9ACTN|nr:HEXXH motif domain-containing protein [Actinoplanes ferrugineus]GIE14585.1 hypothetical protein Afe05nite_64250 [Actinoplanes ferrugineus]